LFISNWVRTYNHHQGILECCEEHYETQNLPYLLAFGRETDAVRGLVFGEAFGLLAVTNPLQAENDQRIQALGNILQTFNRETITSIVFRNNYLTDYCLKLQIPSLAQYTRLNSLELSHNQLTNASLEALSVIFSNCPSLTKLDLSHNLFGQGER
jgi:Leucine-rich repeat (LRR) protein